MSRAVAYSIQHRLVAPSRNFTPGVFLRDRRRSSAVFALPFIRRKPDELPFATLPEVMS